MASALPLDYEALLAPIAADAPCGSSVPFDIRKRLEEARKEENPADYADDDPMRPTDLKKADWNGIVQVATETLSKTSKDLQVAARLTEALAQVDGFPGLQAGLHLLLEMVNRHWDGLYPQIEDGDVEVRAGPFYWLDDAVKGARFPNTIRNLPLLNGRATSFSWHDWRQGQDGKGAVSRDDIDKIINSSTAADWTQTVETLTQTLSELTQLTQALGEKMSSYAPGMTGMRQPLEECYVLARDILKRRPADSGAEGADGQTDGSGTQRGSRSSREEVYRQLADAAERLRQLEPHSPIPYLIQRAVQLGSMSFPQLIRQLVRDETILGQLTREFGIAEEAGK